MGITEVRKSRFRGAGEEGWKRGIYFISEFLFPTANTGQRRRQNAVRDGTPEQARHVGLDKNDLLMEDPVRGRNPAGRCREIGVAGAISQTSEIVRAR